jgi:transposase-like protein
LPFGLRFPLSLRMVKEMLAFRGIEVSYEEGLTD